jgi:hypothetical protein
MGCFSSGSGVDNPGKRLFSAFFRSSRVVSEHRDPVEALVSILLYMKEDSN